MAKKRKKIRPQQGRKKTNNPAKNSGLRKKHLKTLEHICRETDCEAAFKLLTKEDKVYAFGHRVYTEPLKLVNKEAVSADSLAYYAEFVKRFYNTSDLPLVVGNRTNLTNFEILTGLQFLSSLDRIEGEKKQQLQIAFTPMRVKLSSLEDVVKNCILHHLIVVNSTNCFNETIYSLKFNYELRSYPTYGISYYSSLEAFPCRPSNYAENGHVRKVYQLGYLDVGYIMKWAFVPVKLLKDVYVGDKKYLPLCIQNHAYHRLLERLQPIIDMDIIFQLSSTIKNSVEVIIYKGKILIPYYYFDHKCGYFLAVINKNRLIIKTFLFLTHHYTPEGEKLENALGISKEEISYWNIGTLENFIYSDLGKNHDMKAIFKEVGISHLFDISLLSNDFESRNYNWEALSNYINLGKTEIFNEGATDEDFEAAIKENVEAEIT